MPENDIEVLQGVQFLISKWESNEIPADIVRALIEIHLEREGAPAPLKEDHD